ncbi:YegP family protein [Aquimarina sp. M1]
MFELKNKEGSDNYHFTLKAKNGQVILSSEVYNSKAAAINGIASVQKNAVEDGRYERKTAKDGKFFFNLKATNGQVIGSSQMYSSESGMENGINSVKENAPEADTKEA